MVELIDFYNYLSATTNLSESTFKKYESAVRVTSKQMLEIGVIDKPFYEMTPDEFEVALLLTLNNEEFKTKNKIGNNMYSNGLKQYQSFLKCSEIDETNPIVDRIKADKNIPVTERKELVKSRVGQGIFRKKLLEKYHACIVTNVADERLLIASHIKPWSVSNNFERLSVDNGLLLNVLYDKMFDLGIISFTDEGKILISSTIKRGTLDMLSIDTDGQYDLRSSAMLLRNMEYHRDVVFLK